MIGSRRQYIYRPLWQKHHDAIAEGHVIHHINGNSADDRIENLICVTHSEHRRLHHLLKRLPETATARITPEVSARLDRHCEETGRTRQWVVRQAIEDYLSGAE